MFDVGFWEILLILILALVVIGPERLPGAARTLGLWVGKGRRYIEGVKSEVEQEFDISEFKRVIHNQEIQLNELQQKVNKSARMSADDLLGSHEHTHNIVEESSSSEENSVTDEDSSTASDEETTNQKKNPE